MKQRRGWSSKNCSVSCRRDVRGTSLEMTQLSVNSVVSAIIWRKAKYPHDEAQAAIRIHRWSAHAAPVALYELTKSAARSNVVSMLNWVKDRLTHKCSVPRKDQDDHDHNHGISLLERDHALVHEACPRVRVRRHYLERCEPAHFVSPNRRYLPQTPHQVDGMNRCC